jgi:hypothetical protein
MNEFMDWWQRFPASALYPKTEEVTAAVPADRIYYLQMRAHRDGFKGGFVVGIFCFVMFLITLVGWMSPPSESRPRQANQPNAPTCAPTQAKK